MQGKECLNKTDVTSISLGRGFVEILLPRFTLDDGLYMDDFTENEDEASSPPVGVVACS